ncbi:MAG: NIPSNAP family protein [Acidobacteria bacterium]|nr:NIPSNAP family protein [Acidobacteriota bacterium]
MASLAAAAPATAAPADKRTRYYVLEQYFLKNGSQPQRMQEFFSKSVIPALGKVHTGPKLFLEAVVAPHMPQVAAILGYESLDQILEVQGKVMQDPELAKAWREWELGPEQPFESQSNTLLMAEQYSPEIEMGERKTPRLFELRVYHSPSWNHLFALHQRFAGPETKIFHRCGIHPVLYTSTLFGQSVPNLTYLIPFESLAEREKAWAAFSADPEWIKVRKESVEKSGQVTSVIQISLYKAAAYSPVK